MVLLVVVTVVRGCAADICDLPDLCRSRRQPVHSKVPRLDCVVFNGGKVCWSVGNPAWNQTFPPKALKRSTVGKIDVLLYPLAAKSLWTSRVVWFRSL